MLTDSHPGQFNKEKMEHNKENVEPRGPASGLGASTVQAGATQRAITQIASTQGTTTQVATTQVPRIETQVNPAPSAIPAAQAPASNSEVASAAISQAGPTTSTSPEAKAKPRLVSVYRQRVHAKDSVSKQFELAEEILTPVFRHPSTRLSLLGVQESSNATTPALIGLHSRRARRSQASSASLSLTPTVTFTKDSSLGRRRLTGMRPK